MMRRMMTMGATRMNGICGLDKRCGLHVVMFSRASGGGMISMKSVASTEACSLRATCKWEALAIVQ